ncbi:MAG: metallo-beta-lactamase family protein [Parcubacteria group bacterium Gr01-1014_20]|nr:MAG: metallo-beta-lactamase family protein [Parcubacteria group bacterium Gr01-1014_20]
MPKTSSTLRRPPFSFIFKLLFYNLVSLFKPIRKAPKEEIVIKSNEIRIWALGHATVLINLLGKTILTDPIFSNWLPPFIRRSVAYPFEVSELPPIDYLVISHAHLDHFHKKSLRLLAPKTANLIIPSRCLDLIRGMEFKNVVELGWGETYKKEVTIHTFKPRHWGFRYLWEKEERGYNAYLFENNGKSVFFGGDTGYGDLFKKVSSKYSVGFAILPIGAYNNPPTFRPNHMNPEDALQAFKDLKAKHLIPIHWGNFKLSLEPINEPAGILGNLAKLGNIEDRVHILENGKSFSNG